MAVVDDFVASVLQCQNPSFEFPGLPDPGFPNFLVSLVGSLTAGVTYVLDYLPPSQDNVPALPTVQIFIDGFMATLNIPSANIPEIEILPGFTIPAVGDPNGPTAFDLSGLIKLLKMFILLPFELFKLIIQSIINLSPQIPSVSVIKKLFEDLAASLGFDLSLPALQGLTRVAGCIAVAIFAMLTSLIPV